MKRVELLEALFLQGKKMRELQVYYFSLRKGGGRFSSPEAKKVLAQSKLEELQYDKMVKELDEWWDNPPTPEGGADLDTFKNVLDEFMFSPENADPVKIAFLNDGIIVEQNDGDDDIRI